MRDDGKWGFAGWAAFGAVVALACGLRGAYLHRATESLRGPAALAVQGAGPRLHLSQSPTEDENLVENLTGDERWFGCLAPLAVEEEKTAHRAPAYPWILGIFARAGFAGERTVRILNLIWGVGAVILLFLATRRAFGRRVALCTGLLAAAYPFWIVNVGEKADGCLAVFCFAASFFFAMRSIQTGAPGSCLGFGLAIGLLAMTRGAAVPFATVALFWHLLRCRSARHGWFAGLLATLGFSIAVGPWALRNWKEYERIVPVADSSYLHLYVGNNPWADGGPMDEAKLRSTLPAARLERLLQERNQAARYEMLAQETQEFWRDDPSGFLRLRYAALQRFLFGARFLEDRKIAERNEGPGLHRYPESLERRSEFVLLTSLLSMLALGFLGWVACKGDTAFLTLALWTLPLPYVMSHAESLAGPRLLWDAVLIVFAGGALAKLRPSPDH